ncbi:MAG: hypothetical protein H6706_01645 [Myxococcales bacterium]|nr:hypothetical protein [Myxococcales bacterium]
MENRFARIFGTLLQSDVATRLVQNEALMNALMKAFSMSVELRHLIDQRLRAVVQGLDLAKASEVEALREELADLQAQVEALEERLAEREEVAQRPRPRRRPASRSAED